ncbi:MAG: hypothetical protein ACJ77O_04870, partial [Chloroflexota bacterium]
MDRNEFLRHYTEWQRGHITRRQFMAVTGLGVASAVIAACAPSGAASPAASTAPAPSAAAPSAAPSASAAAPSASSASVDPAADWAPPKGVDLGTEHVITTWPNYHDPATSQKFTDLTGVKVELNPLGSNEEM